MSTVISYKDVKIKIDLTESEDHKISSTSTDYIVEDGSTKSDHITIDGDQVIIKGFCSEITRDGVEDPHFKTLEALTSAVKKKELFTVETIVKTYYNMHLSDLGVSIKQGDGTSLFLTLSFKEFIFSTAKETKAPKDSIKKESKDRFSKKSSKGQVNKKPLSSNNSKKLSNNTKAVANPNKAQPKMKAWDASIVDFLSGK